MLITPNLIIWAWARIFQNHLWPEQIKTETITSLKSMLTIWLAKPDRNELLTSSNLKAVSMLLIQRRLTCAFPYSGGRSFVRKKAESKCIHYMMWRHRYQHFSISQKLLFTTLQR